MDGRGGRLGRGRGNLDMFAAMGDRKFQGNCSCGELWVNQRLCVLTCVRAIWDQSGNKLGQPQAHFSKKNSCVPYSENSAVERKAAGPTKDSQHKARKQVSGSGVTSPWARIFE